MPRHRRQTPTDIEHRNHKKRCGAFQVWVTEDLKFIGIQSNRKDNPQSVFVMEQLRRLGAEVQDLNPTKDKHTLIAWVPVKAKPEATFAALKLVSIPDRCERCKGKGEIDNPVPMPQDPPRGLMETSREYHDRVYAERTAAGIPTSWGSIVKCPACLGSGRVAQVEDDEPVQQTAEILTTPIVQNPDGSCTGRTVGRFRGPLRNAQNIPKPKES